MKSGESISKSTEKNPKPLVLEEELNRFGDLLMGLVTRFTPDSEAHRPMVRQIIKAYVLEQKKLKTELFQRPLLLQIAVEHLLSHLKKWTPRKLTPEEILLDTALSTDERLNAIDMYLTRLSIEDRMILFFLEQHQLSLAEVAVALKTTEGSLKNRRQQLYRSLEEWIWNIT